MQVLFNPYITNQQQVKQPTHKAVIQKYVDVAKKDIKACGMLVSQIPRTIMIDVLTKSLSPIDAIETLEKIKNFAPNSKKSIDSYIKTLYKML